MKFETRTTPFFCLRSESKPRIHQSFDEFFCIGYGCSVFEFGDSFNARFFHDKTNLLTMG